MAREFDPTRRHDRQRLFQIQERDVRLLDGLATLGAAPGANRLPMSLRLAAQMDLGSIRLGLAHDSCTSCLVHMAQEVGHRLLDMPVQSKRLKSSRLIVLAFCSSHVQIARRNAGALSSNRNVRRPMDRPLQRHPGILVLHQWHVVVGRGVEHDLRAVGAAGVADLRQAFHVADQPHQRKVQFDGLPLGSNRRLDIGALQASAQRTADTTRCTSASVMRVWIGRLSICS